MPRVSITMTFLFIAASVLAQEFRSIDGSQNHSEGWGSAGEPLKELVSTHFADGVSEIVGTQERPNSRIISNVLFKQDLGIVDPLNLSDYVWTFGEFINSDLGYVESHPNEFIQIPVPADDEFFIENEVNNIYVQRSAGISGTGIEVDGVKIPRAFANRATAFLDASMIYGSDYTRAQWLRLNDGSGKLKTSQGNLLPWDTRSGEFNDNSFASGIPDVEVLFGLTKQKNNIAIGRRYFVTGDIRSNRNPLLITLHTLFVREHNRICDELVEKEPEWRGNDDLIYRVARKKVSAYLQSIVYNEWLPVQGVHLPEYSGYKSNVNPSISKVFLAAAMRLNHTLMNSEIARIGSDGMVISQGNLSTQNAFFQPTQITLSGGLDPYFKGMATQVQQNMDCKMISAARNLLPAGNIVSGTDLVVRSIERGRDLGLPDYNTVRYDLGMPKISTFEELTGEEEAAAILAQLYDNDIDKLDAWVGMLAEKHMPDAMFGEVIMKIIERQFQDVRDGDRFYFENDPYFSFDEIEEIKSTKLHDIIMRNTEIDLMQKDVFLAMNHDDIPNGPELVNLQLEAAVYPNPTNGDFNLKIYSELDTEMSISIMGIYGETISTDRISLSRGNNFKSLSLSKDLPRGVYNIYLETENAFNVVRLIKEH